ncbi:MAG: hypothetical protein HZB62_06440 [Nitrospirae bacterium]|nr:hypothetical protein [Nitrospirota bacterium]
MKKIIDDFRKGLERVRWFSTVFAERLKIEIAIFRLLYESDRMAKTREELLKKIGERVLALKDHHDKNILRDSVIAEAVAEISKLEKTIEDLKTRVAEIGRVSE